jgi:antitoxin component of RelBE/YafQ-DinJ toxin-antitoxin module
MNKFIIVAEAKLTDEEYKVVESWGVEPSDYIATLIAEHAREKGVMIKTRCVQTEYNMFEDVNKAVETIEKNKAFAELENEITSRACIGGVCED